MLADASVRAKAVSDERFVDYVRCACRVHDIAMQLRVAIAVTFVTSCAADAGCHDN